MPFPVRLCYIVHDNPSLMRASLPARYLIRRGFAVDLIVIRRPEREPHVYGSPQGLGVRLVERGGGAGRRVLGYLRELKPDIVHALAPGKNTFLPGLRYKREAGARLVVDIDEWLSKVYRFPRSLISILERRALREADLVLACSRYMYEAFAARRSRARLGYLPNASDLETFDKYRARAEEVRGRYGGRPIVTYLGTMLPQYQADKVLGIAELVREQRDVQFLMIGGGPLRESLARDASARGMDDYLRFTGFVADEELPGYLCASSALLFPIEDTQINRARCPNKTFLFAAAGVPIVTNRVGEVGQALGEEARYFTFGDWEGCAREILEAIETGEPRPSRATAEAGSWQRRAEEYLEMIAPLRRE